MKSKIKDIKTIREPQSLSIDTKTNTTHPYTKLSTQLDIYEHTMIPTTTTTIFEPIFKPDIIICRDFLKFKIENTLKNFKFNKIPILSFLIENFEKQKIKL